MAKSPSLATMTVEALLKLRGEIDSLLTGKADELRRQLASLTGGKRRGRPPGPGRKKIGKVAPQFRSKKDPALVWSGRGATPRWMREEMKGTSLKKESFRIKE